MPGMGGGMQQPGLFQERDVDGMNEQELIAMQEAILAQMQGENEDIYIDDDEDEYEDSG